MISCINAGVCCGGAHPKPMPNPKVHYFSIDDELSYTPFHNDFGKFLLVDRWTMREMDFWIWRGTSTFWPVEEFRVPTCGPPLPSQTCPRAAYYVGASSFTNACRPNLNLHIQRSLLWEPEPNRLLEK